MEILQNKSQGDLKKIAEINNIKHSTICSAISKGRAKTYIYDAIINFYKDRQWLKETTTLRTDK